MENVVEKQKVVILGAGVTGLVISYYLKQHGVKSIILEKLNQPGGLSRSFEIQNYFFDYGGHCSFAKDVTIRKMLEEDVNYYVSTAIAYNYKKEHWIKHPVQNNLRVLSSDEKILILEDFINRVKEKDVNNYEQWLECSYGKYFTENYPTLYTRKYWTVEPSQLETKWIGPRMYQPNLHEVLKGVFEQETPNIHYSNEIRYPKEGGFDVFLKSMINQSDIQLNSEVKEINSDKRIVTLTNGKMLKYKYLISTIPLPEMNSMIFDLNQEVKESMTNLNYTSLVLVSLGIKKLCNIPASTFYIYDEDILPSRVYSPSIMGGHGNNHVSLQAEVYFSKFKPLDMSLEYIKEQTIEQLIKMGVFLREDLEVADVRFEKYANIIFTPDIYKNRKKIHSMLESKEIYYAGRFADWDYLWTDQSMLSGINVANHLVKRMQME